VKQFRELCSVPTGRICGAVRTPAFEAASYPRCLFHTGSIIAANPHLGTGWAQNVSAGSKSTQHANAAAPIAGRATYATAGTPGSSEADDMAFFVPSHQESVQDVDAEQDIAIMDVAGSKPPQRDLVVKYLSRVRMLSRAASKTMRVA
jgi:hypothetical protein